MAKFPSDVIERILQKLPIKTLLRFRYVCKRWRSLITRANLYNNIIVDILLELPIKSLLRFKCVCKDWRSVISDPGFVKFHLNKEGRQKLQIVRTCLNTTLYSIDSESSVLNNGLATLVPLNVDFVPMNIRYLDAIGCSHGLLCLLVDKKNVVLCNPSTKEFRELPSPGPPGTNVHSYIYGFGYDSSTDDYKVIMGCGVRKEFEDENGMKILALKTNTWRRIQNFEYDLVGSTQTSGVLVNGVIHWIAVSYTDSRNVFKIVGLDLVEENFIEVVQPDHSNTNFIRRLAVLGGCLCLEGIVDNSNCDIWLMKEYGVGDSWTKLISYPANSVPILVAFCFMNNGEILTGRDGKMYIYNLDERTFKELKICNGPKLWFNSWSYKESLVSPNKNLISPNESLLAQK